MRQFRLDSITTPELKVSLARADLLTANSLTAIPLTAILLAAVVLTAMLAGPARAAGTNLVANGNFSTGHGDTPDNWVRDGWHSTPDFTTYTWNHQPNSPSTVEVTNLKANDARWVQHLRLEPGWYHFSALIRTQNVGQAQTGATLSMLEDGIISAQLHGTNDWHRVGFNLKIGSGGANLPLACRLGGYASINTGSVWCQDVSAVQVAAPVSGDPTYDLDEIRNSGIPTSSQTNNRVSVPLIIAVVILVTLVAARRMRQRPSGGPEGDDGGSGGGGRPKDDDRPENKTRDKAKPKAEADEEADDQDDDRDHERAPDQERKQDRERDSEQDREQGRDREKRQESRARPARAGAPQPQARREPREPAAAEPRTIKPDANLAHALAEPLSDTHRQRLEWVLFALALVSFAYFYQASDHSTASRFDLIRAMVERQTLWIEGYAGFNTADIVELRAHVFSNKAPGLAFTGLVPWVLISTPLRLFFKDNSGVLWALATYLTTLATVGLAAATLTVLMFRFALRLGASMGHAIGVALTLAFATLMFPYATEFTAEPVAGLCVFTAFYLLVFDEDPKGLQVPLLAGLLAGWGVLCDYPTFVLALPVALYAAWKLREPRRVATFAAGAAAIGLLLVWYNWAAFGRPFFLSYEAYMLPSNSSRFPEQAVGFAGVTYPRPGVLWQILFAPQRGLFFCNPVTLLFFPGLYYWWRTQRNLPVLTVVAAATIAFILFNGAYGDSVVYWGGGTAVGPRHFAPGLPFMVLALGFLPASADYLWAALALVSAFIMLMTTAVEPHLPYEYLNPIRDFIWPAYLRGDLGYNKATYYGGGPLVGDSVAFNLGKLIRLPGPLQLLPLAVLWLRGTQQLLGQAAPRGYRKPAMAIGLAAVAAMFAPPLFAALTPALGQGTQGLIGRYYEGSRREGQPPHIVRLDPNVDFSDIVALGSLPPPSLAIWSGKLLAPRNGLYHFTLMADDDGWLTIDGHPVIADPGETTRFDQTGSIQLTAGAHRLEVGERNIWGGSTARLYWQPPGVPASIIAPQFMSHGNP